MGERKSIPHLLDEPPISVYPSLAKVLGNVNKAIILQQVHFLLNAARMSNNKYVEIDGKWWVYNSYKQWRNTHFTWLAEVTIKGLFNSLEQDGLIISRQGVKDAFDRKKWYTIDYDCYLTYISSIGQKVSDVHEIKSIPSEKQKVSDDNRKSETPNSEKENKSADAPILSVPTKTNTKTTAPTTEQCEALIKAWVESAGLVDMGQKWATTSRMKHAKAMLSWPIPVTCEEIQKFTKHILATKQNITFEFIQGNLGLWRSTNAPKPIPPKDPNKPMTEAEYDLLLIKEKQEKEAALYGWS